MKSLELKIPPAVVMGLCWVTMWLGKRAAPELSFEMPLRMTLARVCLALGTLLVILGLWEVQRARTTANPLKPASASRLVTSGIYAWTRNPMYLGLFTITVGWAVALANGLSWLLTLLFPLYLTRFQILPEEKALRSVFGEDYRRYCRRVRRWV